MNFISFKTPEQAEVIRQNGLILRQALDAAIVISKPGISTQQLDRAIERVIIENGATPTFKNYGASPQRKGFPASSCISVNNVMVHGIPNNYKLKYQDLVSIDIGVTKNGFIADSCFSYSIGKPIPKHQKLLDAAKQITMYGISLVRDGIHVLDLGEQVANKAHELGFITMPDLFGHGVGSILHEKPTIPFVVKSKLQKGFPNPKLEEGMIITIEPVIAFPSTNQQYTEDRDQWTLYTKDGSYTAQFEHTVYVTKQGCNILTSTFPDLSINAST